MTKEEIIEMAKDLRACERGLESGKGSVPFIITILRATVTKLETAAKIWP